MSSFHAAILGKNSIAVIAEVKRRSPSYGAFPRHSIPALLDSYKKAGAAAISVVTEPKLFDGSIELLEEVRSATRLPIIRKDFITSYAQIDESIRAGANAVLLIAQMMEKDALHALAQYALDKGLTPVIEVHDHDEIAKVPDTAQVVIGINNRDLRTFSTDVDHALSLLSAIAPTRTIIAESAFQKASELAPYFGKIDAVLIGTTLLTSPDPYSTLKTFTTFKK